jgi:cystathionine beta-lyase family protein involved in aluminum resistance
MSIVQQAKAKIQGQWEKASQISRFNQAKVLRAFQQNRVGTHCFSDSTGYGYHDLGREALENVYKSVFKTEAALVRPQIVSGTHAISLCLSILNAGDHLISLSGPPYDTLQQVIGTRGVARASLIKRGIQYEEIPLTLEGRLDLDQIKEKVSKDTRMVMIQRSRGYSWRPSLTVTEIGEAFRIVKGINPDCICFVDNCYGEFAEFYEPSEVGANLLAGSLIKNPGGGLAPSGGYIVGDQVLVELCSEYLTAPGLGSRLGPTFNLTRQLLQGLFIAPHVVGQALKGAILAAQIFLDLGYEVSPLPDEARTDIIQAIKLNSREKLEAFCRIVQETSPVDAQVVPIPAPMPGYDDQVIMAGGTFIQGSSIELSADGPLREPYIAYLQGGLSLEHIELVLDALVENL